MKSALMETKPEVVVPTVPKGFRLLKRNEVVTRGDFIADQKQGMESWEGPTGFRADSFIMPIYRKTSDEG